MLQATLFAMGQAKIECCRLFGEDRVYSSIQAVQGADMQEQFHISIVEIQQCPKEITMSFPSDAWALA